MGQSGSGKSTIIALLQGFYKVEEGGQVGGMKQLHLGGRMVQLHL